MRNFTYALLLFVIASLSIQAQTYSTGMIQLSDDAGLEYSAQIDITATQVTLTMVGPENRWLGLGFDATSMTNGRDVVIYDGTTLSDRSFLGIGIEPMVDERQDWTVQSDVVNSGVRTLVATRDTDSGDSADHVFSTSALSIDLVWARSRFEGFTLEWHGLSRGMTTVGLTLSSQEDVEIKEFSISPNPSQSELNITLTNNHSDMKVEVYDVLGKRVHQGTLTQLVSSIDVSNWKTGVYLVRISNDEITQTKRFIKQ